MKQASPSCYSWYHLNDHFLFSNGYEANTE